MTARGLALVLLRVMAISLAALAAQSTCVMVAMFDIPVEETTMLSVYLPQAVQVLVNILFAAILWYKAPSIAAVIDPRDGEPVGSAALQSSDLEYIGVRLLGLYFVMDGVGSLVASLYGWYFMPDLYVGYEFHHYLSDNRFPIVGGATFVVLGSLCWIGGAGIIKGVRFLRTAGQAKGQPEE